MNDIYAEAKIFANFIFILVSYRKLKIHKTFRRPLGLLVNVVSTLNLGPVFTGNR